MVRNRPASGFAGSTSTLERTPASTTAAGSALALFTEYVDFLYIAKPHILDNLRHTLTIEIAMLGLTHTCTHRVQI